MDEDKVHTIFWVDRLKKEMEETENLEMVSMANCYVKHILQYFIHWKSLSIFPFLSIIVQNSLRNPQKCHALREDFADHQKYQVQDLYYTFVWEPE